MRTLVILALVGLVGYLVVVSIPAEQQRQRERITRELLKRRAAEVYRRVMEWPEETGKKLGAKGRKVHEEEAPLKSGPQDPTPGPRAGNEERDRDAQQKGEGKKPSPERKVPRPTPKGDGTPSAPARLRIVNLSDKRYDRIREALQTALRILEKDSSGLGNEASDTGEAGAESNPWEPTEGEAKEGIKKKSSGMQDDSVSMNLSPWPSRSPNPASIAGRSAPGVRWGSCRSCRGQPPISVSPGVSCSTRTSTSKPACAT